MARRTVKCFNIGDRFGFLALDDSVNDVVVDFSVVSGNGPKSLETTHGSSSTPRRKPRVRRRKTPASTEFCLSP